MAQRFIFRCREYRAKHKPLEDGESRKALEHFITEHIAEFPSGNLARTPKRCDPGRRKFVRRGLG